MSTGQASDDRKNTDDLFRQSEMLGIPLALSAQLATGSAGLGQLLKQLKPGELISLETPLGEPAYLLANGARIAAGEIVAVEGKLQFRVTHLGERS